MQSVIKGVSVFKELSGQLKNYATSWDLSKIETEFVTLFCWKITLVSKLLFLFVFPLPNPIAESKAGKVTSHYNKNSSL